MGRRHIVCVCVCVCGALLLAHVWNVFNCASVQHVCVYVCVRVDRGGNSSSIRQYSGWPGVPVGNWILKFRTGDNR